MKFYQDDLEGSLPEEFLRGLSTANLFGRAQIVNDKPEKFDENSELNGYCGNLIFYLDSAHTPESLEACAKWFSNALWDNQHPTKNDFINEPHGNSDSQCSMKHCNQPERISKKVNIV